MPGKKQTTTTKINIEQARVQNRISDDGTT